MKTALLLFLFVGASFGQTKEELHRQLAEARDELKKNKALLAEAMQQSREAIQAAKDAMEDGKTIANSMVIVKRTLFENNNEAFLLNLVSLMLSADLATEGLQIIFSDSQINKQNLDFLGKAAGCLAQETTLRKQWETVAKGEMTKSMRDTIGVTWLEISKKNDMISAMVKTHQGSLPDSVLKWRTEREVAKAAPRPPEPQIVPEE